MQILSTIAQPSLALFINMLQHLDPQIWTPLAPHQQKILCFQMTELSPWYWQITPEGLTVIPPPAKPCDVTFSGPLTAFIAFILRQQLSHQELHIRGDLDCAKAFYEVWQHLDIDWEGHLATLIGPVLARLSYQSLQQTKHWLKTTWQARQQDLSAFLQDEIRLLPSLREIEFFFQDIVLTRDAVERLAARIQRIQNALATRK